MKDTDLINWHINITVRQARYLRQKFHDWSRNKLSQHKKTGDYNDYQDAVMLEGFSEQFKSKLKEHLIDNYIGNPDKAVNK